MQKYTLEGMIEFDEAYFTVESSEIEQEKGIRGKGAVGKQNVAVMAESTPLEDIETGKMKNKFASLKRRFWMDTVEKKSMKPLKESIDNQSIVFTDKSTSYVDMCRFCTTPCYGEKFKRTTEETLKWSSYCY